jgi:excinuclease UvrABC nuclease subunit
MIYIYTLSHPLTGEVRYIGKTVNLRRRLSEHCTKKNYHCKKSEWVKALLSQGLRPVILVIDEVEKEFVNETEQYWISQFKTWDFNLLNTQKGGDQAPYIYSPKYQKRKK